MTVITPDGCSFSILSHTLQLSIWERAGACKSGVMVCSGVVGTNEGFNPVSTQRGVIMRDVRHMRACLRCFTDWDEARGGSVG